MAITAGLTTDCAKSCPGGVRRIWIANETDVDSFTFGVNDEITAITMVTSAVFYELQLKRQTRQFVQTSTVDDTGCSIGFEQSLTGLFQCYNQTIRTWLKDFADGSCCGYVVIIEDNNGFLGVFGHVEQLPAQFGPDTQTDTGTTIQDPNQITINVICNTTSEGLLTEFTGGVAGIPV